MPDNQMPAKVWLRLCGGGVSMPGGRAYQSVAGGSREAARHAAYVRSDIAERMADALERIERGGIAVLLDAALSDAPDGFDECPINPQVLQQMVDDARSALSAWKDGR